jgi:hypothetical protein
MFSNHSGEIYECEICMKEIYRKDSFKKHYRTCHPEEDLPEFFVKKSKDTQKYLPVKFNIKSKNTASIPPPTQFSQAGSTKEKEPDNTQRLANQDILQDIMKALTSLRK